MVQVHLRPSYRVSLYYVSKVEETYYECIQYAYADPESTPHCVDHCDEGISRFESVKARYKLSEATKDADLTRVSDCPEDSLAPVLPRCDVLNLGRRV